MLGATLVPHLAEIGHDVIEAPSRTRALRHADLSVTTNVHLMMDAARPDVVLNLAALSSPDECEMHPTEAYAVNAGLVRDLAGWITSSAPSCRLIHVSSDQVYDGSGPHDEGSVRPCNYYGFSKLLSEQYAAAAHATSLRTNFFGRSRAHGRASLSDWVVTSAREGRAITVFDDVRFTPLSMSTLVESITRVIAAPVPGVFNLGSSDGMSKADFAFALSECLGLSVAHVRRGVLDDVPAAARRPRDMRMSSARFHATFGGAAPALLDEIRRCAEEYA